MGACGAVLVGASWAGIDSSKRGQHAYNDNKAHTWTRNDLKTRVIRLDYRCTVTHAILCRLKRDGKDRSRNK